MRKISLNLTAKDEENIKALLERNNHRNKSEVISKALSIYKLMMDKEKEGHSLNVEKDGIKQELLIV